MEARIRSVFAVAAPAGSVNVDYCATGAFTLTLPAQEFPNVPGEQIPAYLWEIPVGWGVQGATLVASFPTTPSSFRVYQGTRAITLTPLAGGDVSLRVFPYSSTCNQTYYPSQPYRLVGSAGYVQVHRNPSATVTTAPFTITCGDIAPRTFTATASQSLGSPTFNWTLPTGWTISGPTTGATITAIPNGNNGGNVTATATYGCTSPAYTTAASSPLVIGFDQNLAPVFINPGLPNPTLYCGTSSVTASAVGGTYFQWSADHGATVTPSVTTTSGAPVAISGGWDGPITVTVVASSPGHNCNSSSTHFTLTHNRAVITEANNPIQLYVTTDLGSGFYAPNGTANCNRPTAFEISGLDFYDNSLPNSDIRWIVNGHTYTSSRLLGVAFTQAPARSRWCSPMPAASMTTTTGRCP